MLFKVRRFACVSVRLARINSHCLAIPVRKPLCCLMLLVAKLPITGRICPVRVLFHKLPPNVSNNSFLALLRCPKSPLRYLCIKSLLWTRKITLSRFRTVRKQSLFMDSKNYPLRCPKITPVLLKQSEKLPLLWTPKTPVIGACLACARDTCPLIS